MNTEMINDLVKESLNPYVVIRLVVNHTKEEMDVLEQKLVDLVGVEELDEIYKPSIIIETSDIEGYMFAPKTTIPKFANLLDMCEANYVLEDATDKIWEMNDISFLTEYEEVDPAPELTVEFFPGLISENEQINNYLKTIFSSKYSVDDVLDKISRKGIESLNIINKYILEQ
jgi:hypothetical protein